MPTSEAIGSHRGRRSLPQDPPRSGERGGPDRPPGPGVARHPPLDPPIPTVEGRLCDGDDVTFILYPFVEGVSGGRDGMSPAQWKELGVTVRAFHDLRPDHQLTSLLRTEEFVSDDRRAAARRRAATRHDGGRSGRARACERMATSPRADRSARCANGVAGPGARDRAGPPWSATPISTRGTS